MINYGFFTRNRAENKYFVKSVFINLSLLITLFKAQRGDAFFDCFSGP